MILRGASILKYGYQQYQRVANRNRRRRATPAHETTCATIDIEYSYIDHWATQSVCLQHGFIKRRGRGSAVDEMVRVIDSPVVLVQMLHDRDGLWV